MILQTVSRSSATGFAASIGRVNRMVSASMTYRYRWFLSFAASHTLMHFINRCTWKSSQSYIILSMMTSFMRMSQKLVFHQSKCICAIKPILSTTAMYVSSSSFMYLRFPCYCDACLDSSDLGVGLKTLQYNTIYRIIHRNNCLRGLHKKNIQKWWLRTMVILSMEWLTNTIAVIIEKTKNNVNKTKLHVN